MSSLMNTWNQAVIKYWHVPNLMRYETKAKEYWPEHDIPNLHIFKFHSGVFAMKKNNN